ncbi:3'(2'),5'-bisphosphate nucleotidase CysQ [Hansschlegelia zhihuaiae]|uniref:3'(2'),5'-bisphosphate nucleotidase CysQ n=1 Tax=Hansschlegelia zhihuaiae TaxID=405005 RepID=A0A4Q0MNM9_9HYPH|nr:3'(2'),5'-bisphosphate nucleotidase CysQ [Hansschlegelia zhihuaiae]RXF75380.1 3'(2'),5'-bisphosphate nucleotidase [Hansschlegelia zhihuaiae]
MHDAARDAKLLAALAALAVEAGRAILDVYEGPEIASRAKDDRSPVTDADERAEAILISGLAALFPNMPVIAEEAASRDGTPEAAPETFLLVDPLDGTREFLARNGEFTVNVGLVDGGRPVLGCVFAPALGAIWLGAEGLGAKTARADLRAEPAQDAYRPIAVRPAPEAGLCAVASRSHADPATEEFLASLKVANRRSAGSSLKFCLVAEGEADVYPRFGPTMEWDTAAGHAVLAAAGGVVLKPDGSEFGYGKSETGFRNGAFVAWGRR